LVSLFHPVICLVHTLEQLVVFVELVVESENGGRVPTPERSKPKSPEFVVKQHTYTNEQANNENNALSRETLREEEEKRFCFFLFIFIKPHSYFYFLYFFINKHPHFALMVVLL